MEGVDTVVETQRLGEDTRAQNEDRSETGGGIGSIRMGKWLDMK